MAADLPLMANQGGALVEHPVHRCAQIAPFESGADLAQRESASRSRSSYMTMLTGSPGCVRSIMTLPVIMRP